MISFSSSFSALVFGLGRRLGKSAHQGSLALFRAKQARAASLHSFVAVCDAAWARVFVCARACVWRRRVKFTNRLSQARTALHLVANQATNPGIECIRVINGLALAHCSYPPTGAVHCIRWSPRSRLFESIKRLYSLGGKQKVISVKDCTSSSRLCESTEPQTCPTLNARCLTRRK